MYALLLGVALCAPQETDNRQQRSSPAEFSQPRRFQDIDQDIRRCIRRDAQAKTNQERAAAVYELTQLYAEVRRDQRLPTSPTLKKYKTRIWSRLTSVKQEIEKQLARQQRQSDKSQSNRDVPTGSLVNSGNQNTSSVGAMGGRAVPDWGPGLVALIERTIAPEFWDVNGGPGTIFYFYPLRVLVVRATSEVHHQIGGSLTDLRDAGK